MNDSGHCRITIAACGPGAAEYITPAVNAAVSRAEVIAGAPRLLVLFPDFEGEKFVMTADVSGFLDRVQEYAAGGRSVVVLVTGDPGLCSVARPLIERMGAANCRVIPGVSSLQAAFAELRRDWTSARIINAHAGVPQIPFEPLADEETIAVLAGNRSAWQWVMGLARRLAGTHEVYKCSNLTLDGNNVVAVSLSELECMEEGGGTSIFVWVKIVHQKEDRQGKVYFIGVGPGDPELLTRKAEKLLRNCRCCICSESLVNPALLAFLPAGAVCWTKPLRGRRIPSDPVCP